VGGVAVALLAVSMPDTIHRAQRFELRAEKSALRARLQSEMEITVDRAKAKAGGRDKLLAKGHLLGNPSFTHQLAWEMNVPMGDVGGRKLPYVAFSVPKTNASSTAGPRLPTRGVRKERLARYGDWRAVAVSEKKPSP
jgi:hypothetical protein